MTLINENSERMLIPRFAHVNICIVGATLNHSQLIFQFDFADERRARVHRYQSAVQDGTPSPQLHPSMEQIAARIWFKGARRGLRDISPPGMWPVTDSPPELARRRALLTAADYIHQMHANVRESTSTAARSLLRDNSPSGMCSPTHCPTEFARERDLLFGGSNSERSKRTSKIVRESYSSGRKLLRDISPPGMWPVPDAPPEMQELSRRRALLDLSAPSPRFACQFLVQKTMKGVDDDTIHWKISLNISGKLNAVAPVTWITCSV